MYQNMKIEITDEVKLKAVCDVLQSIGYEEIDKIREWDKFIYTFDDGLYYGISFELEDSIGCCDVTLTDLLAMRDKQFMEKIHA